MNDRSDTGIPAGQAAALDRFDRLVPVSPDELTGLWQGQTMETGHPLDGVLENLGWYGKRFRDDHRADALLFRSGPGRLAAVDPRLIPLRQTLPLAPFGRTAAARLVFSLARRLMRAKGPIASIRSMPFRGITSAAMIYDSQPVIDHFRRVDSDQLMGCMVIADDDRHYFFTLRRVDTADDASRGHT